MPATIRRNNRDNNRTLSPYSRLVNAWDRTYETNLEYEEERDIKNELYNGVKNAISKIGTPLEVPHLDILNDDNTENMAFLAIENMRITRERYRGNLYHNHFAIGAAIQLGVLQREENNDEDCTADAVRMDYDILANIGLTGCRIHTVFKHWPEALDHCTLPISYWDKLTDNQYQYLAITLRQEIPAIVPPRAIQQAEPQRWENHDDDSSDHTSQYSEDCLEVPEDLRELFLPILNEQQENTE